MIDKTFPIFEGKQNVLIIVFFSIYLTLSALHLIFAFLEKEGMRKVTKPFLLFLLSLMMFLLFPYEPFLYLGCLFGMIGDIFFIFKSQRKCVYLGMLSFFLNHVFYILETGKILLSLDELKTGFVLLYGILFLILLFSSFFGIKKILKIDTKLSLAGSVYSSSLAMDCLLCLYAALKGSAFFYLSFGGMILFILSDSLLSYTMFIKDIKRRDFYIMLLLVSSDTPLSSVNSTKRVGLVNIAILTIFLWKK